MAEFIEVSLTSPVGKQSQAANINNQITSLLPCAYVVKKVADWCCPTRHPFCSQGLRLFSVIFGKWWRFSKTHLCCILVLGLPLYQTITVVIVGKNCFTNTIIIFNNINIQLDYQLLIWASQKVSLICSAPVLYKTTLYIILLQMAPPLTF